jgi:predicted unusual protein kinase regulating ubiquinone biosynthesis (AarF/ABC1/UbiB family)
MFTDLFRIVAEHGLSIPPEIAAVFRALATMEGTLTQLAPGFDIVTETRRFAAAYLPGALTGKKHRPENSPSFHCFRSRSDERVLDHTRALCKAASGR